MFWGIWPLASPRRDANTFASSLPPSKKSIQAAHKLPCKAQSRWESPEMCPFRHYVMNIIYARKKSCIENVCRELRGAVALLKGQRTKYGPDRGACKCA